MDVDDIIRRLVAALREECPAPACAWLFGSVARGDDGADSDVDVAVLMGRPLPSTLSGGALSLESRLERRLDRPVDLVALESAPPDLIHRVLRDGRLLYDDDPSLRVRFETRARREYFDVLPYLREYRRAGGRVVR